MTVETPETDETPVVTEKFSKVFPTCIKYETSDGAIEELWVKEGGIKFVYDSDEEGNPVSARMVIQIEIEDSSKDLVVQRYARQGLFG